MLPVGNAAASATPWGAAIGAVGNAVGAMMSAPDPSGGPSNALGGGNSNAFHADGWVVSTGNATARGGTVAQPAEAAAAGSLLVPAALIAGAVVLAVAMRR